MDIAADHKVYEFDDYRIDVAHLMFYHRGAEIPLRSDPRFANLLRRMKLEA